jgi:HK97 family phage major capsid protein/HK97 family phage prohead protease
MSATKQRAYSVLNIKSVDEESRTITGMATTPAPDRSGDIVEPMGAQYQLPIPLLWQHDSRQPVGHVTAAKVGKDGISITAQLVKISEPGALKDRLDEAWQSLKSGLVRGLSIGFNSIEDARIKDTFSYHFLKWEWLELSCVVIPANADASITGIKSADQLSRAASGHSSSVVGTPPSSGVSEKVSIHIKGTQMKKTIAEQIAGFEAKRAANAARMGEIMEKSADAGETLDQAGTQEYDTLKDEIETIDAHLERLRAHEKTVISQAKTVDTATNSGTPGVSSTIERSGIISVRANVEKGIAFTRYVKAMAMARGNLPGALAIAEGHKGWQDTTPQVAMVLKAAVAAGDTTTVGWASELVYNQNLAAEFIEFLRPMTILGKLTGLTQVPFNVRVGGQNSGSTAYWVGQGAPVPVSKFGSMEVTLGIAKAAGLIVLTEELVRSSSPAAEMLTRNELTRAISQFLDQQFIDPNYGGVANVSPASVTYGVTPTIASGTTAAAARTDVQTVFTSFINANLDPSGAVWIMPSTTALALSLMLNGLGNRENPDISMTGGYWHGLPVITSQSASIGGSPDYGNMIVLANAPEILMADDGQVTIDASREAAIQMLDNPTNNSGGGTTATTMVSMFQTESVAIRATRFINWKKKRSTAVAFIRNAAYTG